MNRLLHRLIILCLLFFLFPLNALVINPIVDTDKSVNTYSVYTIVDDLIDNSMSDEAKLDALFTFHRRMMHHFRLQQSTEDNISTFDIIKLYTVYGCSFCTQQAVVFRQLCSEAFGNNNTMVPAASGTLSVHNMPGGHSSFQMRFDRNDKWHWVDPIIGAYAKNKTDGSIASLEEIRDNPSILIDAEADNRASMPYFMCTQGTEDPVTSVAAAYSYFQYDPEFMNDFAQAWNGFDTYWARQSPYFRTKKNLKKGEVYLWLWDFLEGDYFNLNDKSYAHVDGILTRDWEYYPPRHICGWKDSLDTNNWPYFKPYKKVIKGDTCYRYYANGIHTFEPDLQTDEPKDDPYIINNISFFNDDQVMPAVRPALAGSAAEIGYRFKLPYPVMSLRISGEYTRQNSGDTLALYLARVRFIRDSIWLPGYLDSLSTDTFTLIKQFDLGQNAAFDTLLREFIDPLYVPGYKTSYGYAVKFVMKAEANPVHVGLNHLKVQSIFQHNMFALPQLEPGPNKVTVTADSTDLNNENLKLAFGWMEGDSQHIDEHSIQSINTSYTINVTQNDMPRMRYMALGNTLKEDMIDSIGVEKAVPGVFQSDSVICYPNPFNPKIKIAVSHQLSAISKVKLNIFNVNGKIVKRLAADSRQLTAGITWNASHLPSGLYILRLTLENRHFSKKLLLTK